MSTRRAMLGNSVRAAILAIVSGASPLLAKGGDLLDSVAILLESRDIQDPAQIGAAFGVTLVAVPSVAAMPNVNEYVPTDLSRSNLRAVKTVVAQGAIRPLGTEIRFAGSACIPMHAFEQRFSGHGKAVEVWAPHAPVKWHAGFAWTTRNSRGAEFEVHAAIPKEGGCAGAVTIWGSPGK